MSKCSQCKIDFPEHLVAMPICANGIAYQTCPICALAVKNATHGINDKHFQGKVANQLLEEAREFVRSKQCQN